MPPRSTPLKTRHYFILLSLAASDRHGLAIAREVERLSEGRVRPAARVYRVLLRGAPRALRLRYGREMELMFLESLDHARRRGAWGAASEWAHAALDIAAAHTRDFGRRVRHRGRVG